MFSGGQDSTTALGWCLKNFDEILSAILDYGQNHIIELKSTKKIVKEIENNFDFLSIK